MHYLLLYSTCLYIHITTLKRYDTLCPHQSFFHFVIFTGTHKIMLLTLNIVNEKVKNVSMNLSKPTVVYNVLVLSVSLKSKANIGLKVTIIKSFILSIYKDFTSSSSYFCFNGFETLVVMVVLICVYGCVCVLNASIVYMKSQGGNLPVRT